MDEKFKTSTNPNSLGRVIYEAPQQMIKLIKMIKRFSISTTLISAGVQPFLYPKLVATGSTISFAFATVTCAGIFVSPFILNWFTKRYVTELYFDDQTHRFTVKHLNLINRSVLFSFKSNQVTVPETLGIFTTFIAGENKRPFFVDPNQVIDVEVYKKMLGFDKPIDLRPDKLTKKAD